MVAVIECGEPYTDLDEHTVHTTREQKKQIRGTQ